ncbi:MAG: Mur ligase domain-containing protein, partial [Candidatus Omnitrophica bacterium]|nr:Mur ligase domain-containing protein [Candidatus Omnitrophota bacterium]
MHREIHFIGIGGIGMSGIAQLFLERGMKVSGCDIKDSERLRFLQHKGARIYFGHDPSHLHNSEVVVYSSAIKEDNPELKESRKKNLKVLKRAQALVEIIQDASLITITGSHGKTTTSSLVAHILTEAGIRPTVVVGGIWLNLNNSACLGRDKLFVIEADESDGSFLYFKPKYSLITNIDFEHMDYYNDMERLLDTFCSFMNNLEPGGKLIACGENKNIVQLLNKINKPKIVYGFSPASDIYAKNIELNGLTSTFDCFLRGDFLGRFSVSLGGRHNVLNSLA